MKNELCRAILFVGSEVIEVWERIEIPNRQFIQINDLLGAGLSYYKIKKLVEEGRLQKRTKKIYENASYHGDVSDFATVSAYVPRGVICMLSAARYYGLTNYLPDAVDIAIERDMKTAALPDWPPVKIWYFPDRRYSYAQATDSDEGGEFQIYDVEKTVVDILYYRNRVGIEETKEILTKYLAKADRNLRKLHKYADDLGCGKILSTYLEVLL